MKYFFIVQGEGLGHTTQSLALRAMLERNGHEIAVTLLGRNLFRENQLLYKDIPHKSFFSPVFISGFKRKGISLLPTFIFNALAFPVYIYEIFRIALMIRKSAAQKVVVFYDFVGQLASLLSFSGKPVFTISHHYFFEHPSFTFPKDRKFEKYLLKLHSFLASAGACKKLALSFKVEKDIPGERIYVVPPLLRKEIIASRPVSGDYILVYCLNSGFLSSVAGLAGKNHGKEFRVFLNKDIRDQTLPSNISVYGISGDLFLKSLVNAGIVMCTAGFETLCEAIYLNKQLFIVPSANHYEQYCNSIDAKRTGVANVCGSFESADLLIGNGNVAHKDFMTWINKSEEIMLHYLTE